MLQSYIVSYHKPAFQSNLYRIFRVQPKIMLAAYTKIFNEIIRRSGDVFTTPLKLSAISKMSLWMKINYLKLKIRMATD